MKGSNLLQPAGNSGFFIGQAQVLAIAVPDQRFSMGIKEGKPVHFLLFTTDQQWDSVTSSTMASEFRPFVPSLFLYSLIQAAKEIAKGNKCDRLLVEQLHCLVHTAQLEQQAQKPVTQLYTGEFEDIVFYQLMEEMVLKLDRPIRAKEVCERYHLTQAQLNLMFERRLGGTFASIHLKIRLEKALRLLLKTNMALKEIAEQTGFASLSHFSSMFKKKNGYSPTRVRKENGNPVSGFSAMQQV
ncbi:hypothetical protein OI18_21995 [Flavihumibacter solisilvae]|uniref:HTH araC/xylS-type domain-containing protein n=1 Tax=Flavihumibacter solisilvae TaxID=1349421 RepID=A0A0C1L8X4_9BACT|nr:hypothetical protein OI18_21995 [Flavihumibacter solisilvae]